MEIACRVSTPPKFAVFHSHRYSSLTLCRPTGPASDGKQQTLAPCGVETLHAISMKFGTRDYVDEIHKPAKFDLDWTKSGAATGTWNIHVPWLISRLLMVIIAKSLQFIYLVKGTRVTRVKQQIFFLFWSWGTPKYMESTRRPYKAIFLICNEIV